MKNEITVKRLQKEFAKNIIDVMEHEGVSLLEAYVSLSQLMTSDRVIELAKAEINRRNGIAQ